MVDTLELNAKGAETFEEAFGIAKDSMDAHFGEIVKVFKSCEEDKGDRIGFDKTVFYRKVMSYIIAHDLKESQRMYLMLFASEFYARRLSILTMASKLGPLGAILMSGTMDD